jgi:RNase P/RNase MRP subunit p29
MDNLPKKFHLGQRVRIIGGVAYLGLTGTIFNETHKMVKIRLDETNQIVRKIKTNVTAILVVVDDDDGGDDGGPFPTNGVVEVVEAARLSDSDQDDHDVPPPQKLVPVVPAPTPAPPQQEQATAAGKAVQINVSRLNITDANKDHILETIIKSTLETMFGELEGNLHFLSSERSVLASFVEAESARTAVDQETILIDDVPCQVGPFSASAIPLVETGQGRRQATKKKNGMRITIDPPNYPTRAWKATPTKKKRPRLNGYYY